jgi:hypothetical protein
MTPNSAGIGNATAGSFTANDEVVRLPFAVVFLLLCFIVDIEVGFLVDALGLAVALFSLALLFLLFSFGVTFVSEVVHGEAQVRKPATSYLLHFHTRLMDQLDPRQIVSSPPPLTECWSSWFAVCY